MTGIVVVCKDIYYLLWLLAGIHSLEAWAQFQYKSCLFRYRGTHNKDEMLVLLPHLLTHWGRVTHICVSHLTIIGPDNGLSPGRRQAIIWTNAGILLIGPCGTNFSEILIGIHTFSLKKIRLKMSSAKFRPSCLGLNVLTEIPMLVRWHVCNGSEVTRRGGCFVTWICYQLIAESSNKTVILIFNKGQWKVQSMISVKIPLDILLRSTGIFCETSWKLRNLEIYRLLCLFIGNVVYLVNVVWLARCVQCAQIANSLWKDRLLGDCQP